MVLFFEGKKQLLMGFGLPGSVQILIPAVSRKSSSKIFENLRDSWESIADFREHRFFDDKKYLDHMIILHEKPSLLSMHEEI
jgi:hypothetical protein